MRNKNWRLVSWKTAIVLVVVGVAFIFIGNPSGGNNSGNVSWFLAPICLVLLIALGITALIRSLRNRYPA
jgi:ribose/xylose/arabinose/galactoside ABC-type transport system permease subunit